MSDPMKIMEMWVGGENGLLHPADISERQYARGENVFNRGGIVQTRPGYRYLASIPGTKLQGMCIFTPNNARPVMLVAVDGRIYLAKPPFKTFTQLSGLAFNATAKQINFCQCFQSVQQNADTTLELIDPKRLVIIQDDSTKPGYYDGVTAKHLEPTLSDVPVGLWMAFASSRLWVAKGSRVYASDLSNPTRFTETAYIAERSSFELPGTCTGMIETTDQKGLLAFTEESTTAFQSSIRVRTDWQLTRDFQKVILPNCGNLGGFAPVNQYGKTWWYAKQGLISLDAALASQQTSELIPEDMPMMRTRRVLSPDLSGVCMCAVENLLLVSVPAGSRYNTETMVMDQAVTGERGSAVRSWCGVWTGARPVQWAKTKFGGRDRVFFAAYDATVKAGSKIHIWEAFQLDRVDNESRIHCQMETKAVTFNGLQHTFKHAELDLGEIYGVVDLTVYAGGIRGPWMKVLETKLQAKIGSIGDGNIEKTGLIQTYKPQNRVVRTQEFSALEHLLNRAKNPETTDKTVGTDKAFSLLIEWRGQMAVQKIRLVATPSAEKIQGTAAKPETTLRAVNAAGEGI
jgi:hypothetical protein